MKLTRPGNAVYLESVGIWWSEDRQEIHLVLHDDPGTFHTTVNANLESKRGHPNLFNSLANCLRLMGAPAPNGADT